MPTFTSPVSQAQFQTYLKDSSTDITILGFFQTLLDAATEKVYTWLDRDYTPSAVKAETFWGDDTSWHQTRSPVGTLLTWTYIDLDGTSTNPGISDLRIRENGKLVQALTKTFLSNAEHRITFQLPGSLVCPEAVRQVITEYAAELFSLSNQGDGALGLINATARDGDALQRERFVDLSQRHQQMLRPYKRYPI